jgi:transcriptional regulator with XRE-family HTH domain
MTTPEKPRIYLREWRRYRNLTQGQIAEATGIDKGHISRLERGFWGVTPSTLARLAKALDCQPFELYGIPEPLANLHQMPPAPPKDEE